MIDPIPVPMRPRSARPANVSAPAAHRVQPIDLRLVGDAGAVIAEAHLTLNQIDALIAIEADFGAALAAHRLAEALMILRAIVALSRSDDPVWRRVYLDSAQVCLTRFEQAHREHVAGGARPTFDNDEDPA